MAISPDSSESFVREVDENLRRDQVAETARKYGSWAIAAAGAFLLAVGGYLFWQNRQMKTGEADTEQYVQTLADAGAPTPALIGKLDTLSNSGTDGVSAGAKLARAAVAIQAGDRKTASSIYAAMAADDSLAQPYRDIALVRGVTLDFDSMKPDDVIAKLQSLTVPGNAFFGSAGELTGLALMAKGRTREAGQLFAKIAADTTAPATLRTRAVQIAGTLGVDASASLPEAAATPLTQQE